MLARQDRIVAELRDMRRAATDPKTKRYLHEREQAARVVLEWLVALREEMQRGPP